MSVVVFQSDTDRANAPGTDGVITFQIGCIINMILPGAAREVLSNATNRNRQAGRWQTNRQRTKSGALSTYRAAFFRSAQTPAADT